MTKTDRLPYPPEYLQIDITGFCNLNCKMCPQSVKGAIKEKGWMDFGLYKDIIDKAKQAGIFSILLVLTGEPLLHRHLLDMIKFAKQKKFKVQMSTNCTLLTPDKSKEIIESGLDEIILSLDTVNKELYEKYRCGAKFDRVLFNVLGFLEMKKRMKVRVPFVTLTNLQPYQPGRDSAKIEPEFFDVFRKYDVWILPKYFSNWAGLMGKGGKVAYLENAIDKTNAYKMCETIYHRLVVSWDAKVLSCCNDFNRSQIVGDLRRQSVMEAWNSPEFIELRKKLRGKKYQELPLCKNCGVLWRKA